MNGDIFNYNEEELQLLRENTHLGIVSNLRIYKAKKGYEFYKLHTLTSKIEKSCYLNNPELLEYKIRLKKWINSCTLAWKKYIDTENDGFGLDDFSKKVLYIRKKTK